MHCVLCTDVAALDALDALCTEWCSATMLQCRDPGDAVGRLPIVDILIVGSITEIIGRDAHRLITMMNSDQIEKIDGIELNVKQERWGGIP